MACLILTLSDPVASCPGPIKTSKAHSPGRQLFDIGIQAVVGGKVVAKAGPWA